MGLKTTATRRCLWFEGDSRVSVREEPMADPGPGEVSIESIFSAISPGTEMLFYRGDIEAGAEVDTVLEGYRAEIAYPLRYGHATVGRVVAAGSGAEEARIGSLVFAFTPHASAVCIPADQLLPVPADVPPDQAVCFAAAETAVNLVLDCAPLLGERVSVFGLGVIGQLTAGLLARFPLESLTGWDPLPQRRKAATDAGISAMDPMAAQPSVKTEDLAVELSGSAQGFRSALASCRYNGRIVVGSWYGARSRQAGISAFDTAFHRNRVRIIPSQVSTIDPALSGRWSRERRHAAAWEAVRVLAPSRLITQRFPFSRSADAYRLIAEDPAQTLQVLLVHGS
jgi:2-desacetyl-2-hydroxyethyl bacteriochlorophyllide A dehydrogenase